MMPNQRVANATNQSVSPFRFMKDVLSTVAIRDRGGTHPATLSGSHRLTSGTIAHRIHAPTNVDATDAGGKPMDIQVSTIINRPVSAVFARVADFEQWPQWEGSFVAVKRQSATPNMVGTVYWCTRKLPQAVESSFVITAYEPDQQVMIEGEWVGQFKPAGGYRLEAVADGTKVTSIGRPQLRGLFKLLTPVMAIMGTRLSKTYLSNLKRLVESR
jgi:hypothetical protein